MLIGECPYSNAELAHASHLSRLHDARSWPAADGGNRDERLRWCVPFCSSFFLLLRSVLNKGSSVNAPNQYANQGCGVRVASSSSWGHPFNAGGGGYVALVWTEDGGMAFYDFPRGRAPLDLAREDKKIDPLKWGTVSGRLDVCAAARCKRADFLLVYAADCPLSGDTLPDEPTLPRSASHPQHCVSFVVVGISGKAGAGTESTCPS